ncbi:hypothetical protein QTN25_000999 [Entamoeba marina]
MLTFFAFITVSFAADIITEVISYTPEDSDQIYDFFMFKLDTLYCSDFGSVSTLKSDFIEGKNGFICRYFGDDADCSYASDESNKIAYKYITNECILDSQSSSYQYTLDGTTVSTKFYYSRDCSGTVTNISVRLICNTCDAENSYLVCGEEGGAVSKESSTVNENDSASYTLIVCVTLVAIEMMI